jgi:hypothetical protein
MLVVPSGVTPKAWRKIMENNNTNPNPNAVLTPEQFVEQLRALVAQIGPVVPLTVEQRRILKAQTKTPQAIIDASINVIGAADNVSQGVGIPAADVRQMVEDLTRWAAVEGELRAALNGVAGANLVRRQRLGLVAAQGYGIGRQLARDPEHADLVPHVDEVKRLRKIARRKRAAQSPEPAPAPSQAVEPSKE